MSQTVLLVEDDASLRDALCTTLRSAGLCVAPACDGQQALELVAELDIGLVVSDVQMAGMDGVTLLNELQTHHPDIPVLLMTAFGTIDQAVAAMRSGACDYLTKPFQAEVLVSKVTSLCIDEGPSPDDEFIAIDVKSVALKQLAQRVAGRDVTVLISGESGTGKEVLARYIHAQSTRSQGPFVAINCAAIPENMLEAVLFGYEKGAYTGAHKACPGKFEQAQRGTILLDEISEMDLGLQAKLLRVLQEREVERLGGKTLIALDVRVLATSNRDMREAVDEGRFREDLYYRLNVFPLHMSPLRERPADIVPIAQTLIRRAVDSALTSLPVLTPAAGRALESNGWKGNIRELDNTIQRALVLSSGDTLDALDFGFESAPVTLANVSADSPDRLEDELKSQEHRFIADVLRSENGNRKATAERLGISPRTLRYKLARMRESGYAQSSPAV